MIIRSAGPADALLLAELHKAVFHERAWDEAFWRGAINAAYDQVFLLGDPERAFAALRLLGDEAEVLTVGTTVPRNGDGQALMSGMIRSATHAGAGCLFLEVSTANKAALRLYELCGFEAAGRRTNYYRDGSDALVMRRDLAKGE